MAKIARKKRLIVLDTHAILHRAYHALPEFSSGRGEPTGGLYGLISMLVRIAKDLKPDYIAAALDLPGPTFRDAVFKEYKGTRAKTDDALVSQLKATPDLLRAFGIPVYSAKEFEADDIIGTIVEQTKKKKDLEVIIASGDMDTLQLIEGQRVKVFTLRKGLTDTVMYDEAGVLARYGFGPKAIPDYKGLRGDPSDNIPGVKGVGEKTATVLIAQFGTIEKLYGAIKKNPEKVLAAGCKEGMLEKLKTQEEEARFSRLLAEIRRDAPIDFTLPAKPWLESTDVTALMDMMAEFDFRSLMPRVKQLFSGEAVAGPLQKPPFRRDKHDTNSFAEASAPAIEDLLATALPQEEFDELALMAWVLDSTLAQPTLEDIYRAGKSKDPKSARATLLKNLKQEELLGVYEKIERPLMPVLRAMERRGIKVDKKFLHTLSGQYHEELDRLAAAAYKTAGKEFNLNSPRQLGEVLFDTLGLATKKKTAGGQRSTRESELQKLAGEHPIIGDILAHRELAKLLGTYIDAIPPLLDSNDRLHTHYVQTGSVTGRISSQDPNLQNIPIKSDLGRRIRRAFVADKGYTLMSFDYSQIELRIAAMLSSDKGLIDIFKSGRDVHAEVAARVFNVQEADVSPEQRRRAKVINFGILYGMGVSSLQQTLGTSRKEAQEFYNQYFAAFPKLRDYIEETKADASRQGYTQTLFGRRRYLPAMRSPIPYVRASAERMAINAPIQGTQADLIKLAMIEVHDFLEDGHKGHILLQVHDELVFEIKEERLAECAPAVRRIMEEALPKEKTRGVPVGVEGKAGPNWGEMQKL